MKQKEEGEMIFFVSRSHELVYSLTGLHLLHQRRTCKKHFLMKSRKKREREGGALCIRDFFVRVSYSLSLFSSNAPVSLVQEGIQEKDRERKREKITREV